MSPPTFVITGPVSFHVSGFRIFGIQLKVFKERIKGENFYRTFSVIFHFPDSPRWKDFKLPFLHRSLTIRGSYIGLYPHNGTFLPCISIEEILFIPPTTSTTEFSAALPTTPPSSNNQLRRPGDPLQTPTRSIQPNLAIDRNSPLQLLPDSSEENNLDEVVSPPTRKRSRKT